MNFVTINNIFIGIPQGQRHYGMFTDILAFPATLNKEAVAPVDVEFEGYVFDSMHDTLREDVDISIAVYVALNHKAKHIALVRNIDSTLYPNHIFYKASGSSNISLPKPCANTDRNFDVFIKVINGETLASVGRDIGLSTQRVRQIFTKCTRALRVFLADEEMEGSWLHQNSPEEMRKNKDEWISTTNRYLELVRGKTKQLSTN